MTMLTMSPTSSNQASKTSLVYKKDKPKIELNTGILGFLSNSPLDTGISKKLLTKSPLMRNRKFSKNPTSQYFPNTTKGQ